jgi:hypothetical protein
MLRFCRRRAKIASFSCAEFGVSIGKGVALAFFAKISYDLAILGGFFGDLGLTHLENSSLLRLI